MSPVAPAGGVSQRSLDVESHEQLYYQLYNMLFEYISNGTYKVGDLIPSETDLVKSMSVSRATVRKAMELLINRIRGLSDEEHACIFISFEPENSTAKALYESLGFVPDGRVLYGEVVYVLNL